MPNFSELLSKASVRDRNSLRSFFTLFLETEFLVPERHQELNFPRLPNYPSELVTVLGIKDGERVLVPIFSSSKHMLEWYEHEIKYLSIKGDSLLQRVPEDWWIAIDPGSEVNKELSPWEIALLLKYEPNAIEEIIDEILSEPEHSASEVSEVKASEYPELNDSLITLGKALNNIEKICLVRESFLNAEGNPDQIVVIGVELNGGDSQEKQRITSEINTIAAPYFIGSAYKIRIAAKEDPITTGLFSAFRPLYERPKEGIFSRFLKSLKQ